MKQLSHLCALLRGSLYGPDVSYSGVSIDTRTIKPGEIYVAICGECFNGHDFITIAAKLGAVAAVVDRSIESELPLILVQDTRVALGHIAKDHRLGFQVPLIALTGSCGKTTTKEMIASILKQQGCTLVTQGNKNNEIGVPITLLQIANHHQYIVVELGANHLGEIAYTSGLAQPQIGLITNIGLAHLEGFGSLSGVLRGKSEIAQGLQPDGLMIVNIDDISLEQWQRLIPKPKLISFGFNSQADFTCKTISFNEGRAKFILSSPQDEIAIRLALPGKHNVANALAASAAAYCLGIPLDLIKTGLEQMLPIQGRLKPICLPNGALIIDDTYNANPNSVFAALAYLSQFKKRRIFVLGDLAELGEQAKPLHGQIGDETKQLKINIFYTIGTLSYYAQQTFKGEGNHFTSEDALITTLEAQLDSETVILIKGSRSAQMEKIVSALNRPRGG